MSQRLGFSFFARFLPVWPDRFGDYVFSDREDPKEIAKQMHNLYRFVDGADWLKFGATEDPGETDGFEVPEDGEASGNDAR